MPFLPDPPSDVTGPLLNYLRQVARAINRQPTWSYASLSDPNSTITGRKGDWFENLGSGSTWSRVWHKTGPDNGTASTVSWVLIRIAG